MPVEFPFGLFVKNIVSRLRVFRRDKLPTLDFAEKPELATGFSFKHLDLDLLILPVYQVCRIRHRCCGLTALFMASKQIMLVIQKQCGRIGTVLIYAVLEWILIVLLLIGALWAYLTRKFAECFGLHPPCVWCCRLDHLLGGEDPGFYRKLVCDQHAREISSLGYCHSHMNLADIQGMCEDCLISVGLEDSRSGSSTCNNLGSENHMGSGNDKNPCSGSATGQRFRTTVDMNQSQDENSSVGTINNADDEKKLCSCCRIPFKRRILLRPLMSAELINGHGYVKGVDKASSIIEEQVKYEKVEVQARGLQYDNEETHGFGEFVFNYRSFELDKEDRNEGTYSLHTVGYTELKATSEAGSDDLENSVSRDSNSFVEDNMQGLHVGEMDPKSSAGDLINLTSNPDAANLNSVPVFKPENEVDTFEAIFNRIEHKSIPEQKQVEKQMDWANEKDLHDRHGQIKMPESSHDAFMTVPELGTQVPPQTSSLDTDSNHGHGFKGIECGGVQAYSQTNVIPNSECPEQCSSNAVNNDFTFVQNQVTANNNFVSDVLNPIISAEVKDSIAELVSTKDGDLIDMSDTFVLKNLGKDAGNSEDKNIQNQQYNLQNLDIFSFKVEPVKPQRSDNLLKRSFSTRETLHNDENNWLTLLNRSMSIKDVHHNELFSRQSFLGGPSTSEDHKAPETPKSIEGSSGLQKKFSIERNDSGFDSREGSVLSEIEGETEVERLKRHLQHAQKYSANLYAELEAERNASSDAANQAMAMITRLQEEKAAMQMEALQYQRMVEEQAEYDQEALRLVNELLAKRELEMKDIERELELYRKRFLKESNKHKYKSRKVGNEEVGTPQATSSVQNRKLKGSQNSSFDSYSDGSESSMSETFDNLYLQQKDQDITLGFGTDERVANEEQRMDDSFDESMVDLEEERLSILEQLKVLEERLHSLAEDNEPCPSEEVHKTLTSSLVYSEANGDSYKYPMILNGGERNIENDNSSTEVAKRPEIVGEMLWDRDGQNNVHSLDKSPTDWRTPSMISRDNARQTVEKEVQQLNERLQALETDREFIKHSIKSLKKGERGMNLLQEIVQHLRDLRRIDTKANNYNDSFMQQSMTISSSLEGNGVVLIQNQIEEIAVTNAITRATQYLVAMERVNISLVLPLLRQYSWREHVNFVILEFSHGMRVVFGSRYYSRGGLIFSVPPFVTS